MSARAWSAALVLATLVASAPARARAEGAPILTITEVDQGHDAHVDAGDGVVDINSVLKIKIDRDALRARAADELSPRGASESESLPKLQKVLRVAEEGTRLVPVLTAAAMTLAGGGDAKAFNAALQPLGQAFAAILALIGENDPLYDRLDAALEEATTKAGTPVADQYAAIFAAAASYVRPLVDKLAQELSGQGVYVQIGAWLVTSAGNNPVHLEGLDRYAPAARYEVARYSAPTAAQQQQYAALEQRIDELDRDGKRVFAQFVDEAKRQLEPAVEPVRVCTSGVVADGNALVDELRASAATEADALLAQLAPLRDLASFVSERVTRYRASTPDLATLGEDLLVLVARARAATTTIDGLRGQLDRLGKTVAAFRAKADALAARVKACGETLAASVKTIEPLIVAVTGVGAQAQLNDELLRFGAEVHKFLLADVPRTSELDLNTAGKRAAGDRVVIKVGIGRPGEEARMVESHHIDLFQVLLHVDVSVSLVFLHPTNDDKPTDPQVKLQPAPSYSLVAKPFSCFRDYPGYYRFIDLGVGVNIAAPDFDQDETPELAAGVVVTLFRDFVQGGVGYNFGDRQPYLFFGLRLPYASATVATP
jgi:hypothetical protein